MHTLTLISLPPEVLGEIFSCCSAYNADAPLFLATICRTFYNVAHTSPTAWRKLRLDLDTVTEHHQVRKAGLWFKRAGSCSLDLFVNITNTMLSQMGAASADASEQAFIAKHFSFLIAFLQHHRSRIQTLNVQSDTELKAYYLLDAVYCSALASQFLQLQNLRIRITSDIPKTPSMWSPVFESFSHFPRLQSLKLTNHVLPALSTPNISHLRSLSIVRPLRAPALPIHKILHIISSTPSLIHLDIDSRILVQGSLDHTTRVQVSTLKTLSLRVNNLPQLLKLFWTPTLEELRLSDLDGRRPRAADDLSIVLEKLLAELSLADESGGLERLRTFEVSGVYLPSESLDARWKQCIARMRGLERLVMKNFDADGLVKLLTHPDEFEEEESKKGAETLVCPRLSYVCMSGPDALLPLQRLKTVRPDIRVDWESDKGAAHGHITFHADAPNAQSTYSPGVGEIGFGSSADFERRGFQSWPGDGGAAGTSSITLDDTDSSW